MACQLRALPIRPPPFRPCENAARRWEVSQSSLDYRREHLPRYSNRWAVRVPLPAWTLHWRSHRSGRLSRSRWEVESPRHDNGAGLDELARGLRNFRARWVARLRWVERRDRAFGEVPSAESWACRVTAVLSRGQPRSSISGSQPAVRVDSFGLTPDDDRIRGGTRGSVSVDYV